ncbi:unnamed protein product [Trifolium pratense]|uniref:Uncharacterized protein n=1 Tax=Trifolium pratense TaxID=57577 RepID=A0ACB0JYC9_TRIPR|nr:unnamed protein product [Trifolium pratense]
MTHTHTIVHNSIINLLPRENGSKMRRINIRNKESACDIISRCIIVTVVNAVMIPCIS